MASTTKNVSVRFEITGNGVTVTKELNGSVSKLNLTMEQANSVAKKYGTTLNNLAGKTFKTTNAEFQKMAGNMGGMAKASGGASSAVLELGRVIQDAPYGLRGMANNITQLASQMAFATKSAGGFGAALKQMGKAMIGPLGIVFAVSVVVSALEFLEGSFGKTEKRLGDLVSKGVTEAVSELTTLKNIIEDTSISLERKQDAIRKASEEYDELNISIDGTAESSIEALTALDLLIVKFSDLAMANAITELQTEAMKELAKAAIDTEGSWKDVFSSFDAFKSAATTFIGDPIKAARDAKVKGMEEELKEIEKLFDKPTKSNPDITYAELIFGKTNKKGVGSKRTRAFRQRLLDLQKEFRGYLDENEKLTERSARKRLVIEQEADASELDSKYRLFVEKQTQRHNDYLATVTDLKLREDAQNKHNEAMLDAQLQYIDTSVAMAKRNTTQLAEFDRIEEERQIQANFKLRENEIKHLNQLYEDRDLLFQERQIQLEEERLAELERLANVDGLGDKEKFDAELAVSMQRMELRQAELDHETMIIEERKRVNMEYVGFISQLGGIFQQLAGENEALATAALVVEKGAAIASVVIEAQASIAQKTASANAIPAFLGLGVPNPAYILAQVDAAKANTMTKVSAGLSIASILATSINGGNKSVKGGSNSPSTGQGGREFDFNLVGSTGENQLAQGIAGQFNEPIQAYVVSTQMSSQQQLDARIQSTAALGE